MGNKTMIRMTTIYFIIVIITITVTAAAQEISREPVDYVNPFIGTAKGGNTFPGALCPWGMVSVSPHTAPGSPSGYLHGHPWLYGFGHVHLSGTGCAELGSIIVTIMRDSLHIAPQRYRSAYEGEEASPGYYKVDMKGPGVLAEMSATERSGLIRFTAKDSGDYFIHIDAGTSLGLQGGGEIRFESGRFFSGYNISGGFCGEANRENIFFFSQIDRDPDEYGVWIGRRARREHEASAPDTALGGWLRIHLTAGESVMIKTGISYVSTANARRNLESEQPGWNFEFVRLAAENAWNNELSRMKVEDTSSENKIKFYSALYHCLIHPNIISDVNGDYPMMGRSGSGNHGRQLRYSVYSLWDTYRTLHPLLTLVYPGRQNEMIRTMLDMSRENGYLPKWELAGNETYMMVGDPASVVIADSYMKGLNGFDADYALDAMLKPVTLAPGEKAPPVRAGYHYILEYGYIPFDQDMQDVWWAWGPVSTSLEYYLADWAIAQMAERLGRPNIEAEFLRRAQGYKNLFDTETLFMRPRLKNGAWIMPFDSLATEGSGDWEGSGGPGYVEGNAWNYTFFVPHGIPDLIGLFSGENTFIKKLGRCFSSGHFTITNEPDIAYPYLFTYVEGHEHQAGRLAYEIMGQDFGTGPDGLPGNDDCGAISAWFVFSALGIYPACPASGEYRLGLPLFNTLMIKPEKLAGTGNRLIITKEPIPDAWRTQSVITLNGSELKHFMVTHTNLNEKDVILNFKSVLGQTSP